MSGFTDVTGITVRQNGIIYGCIPGALNSSLIRINASIGDAYISGILPFKSIRSITFDSISASLYCASGDGILYKYNPANSDSLTIGNTGIPLLFSIAINPLNGQMWGVSLLNKVYKINKNTGTAILVGVPGFTYTSAIAFNSKGELYGLKGIGQQVPDLIKYDTATGIASVVGSTNIQGLTSLAFAPSTHFSSAPVSYALYQNYPNPFNGGTTFEFDVPYTSNINLTVFDLLGRKIMTLLNSSFGPGSYKYQWFEPNLPSGIYFYKLKTDAYNSIKKLAIIK
jgi:hypothetical protein